MKCSNSKLLSNRYISFADNKNGWILRNDTLYHTIDGGNQWDPIKLSINNFEMISFQTADNGVAFTDSDPYFTIDSGNTWKKAQIERQIACSDIYFCDSMSGWIAGSGPAFDAGSILATKDGGKSW